MKRFILAALVAFPVVASQPAQAGCSGSWDDSGYSGRCSDGYGSYNISGTGSGSARVNGYTYNGASVYGTMRNGTFSGYVGNRYVTCSKWGCY